MTVNIVRVSSRKHLGAIRLLFREYHQFLGIDLSFQDFEQELASLPGKYGPPKGILLLALDGELSAGCVALREFSAGVCETKRLYVRPAYRNLGLGLELGRAIIGQALSLEYRTMRLDTLERLHEANRLYQLFGFKKIPPYYHNPLTGVLFWELDLTAPVIRERLVGKEVLP